MSSELPKAYDPTSVEPRWYRFWLEQGVFKASEREDDTRPTYVISMPPPNVTGSLHMGHALFGTLQDVLCRHKRMQGMNVLWQPGMDHAGIATQTVVERQLAQEGKSRHDLGREAFIERVWRWKEQSGGRILEQMQVLGCSADWDRLKFTMDPDLSVAVTEAFVRLHEEGLIYRDTRLVNWDVEARTVLSDLEVEQEEGVSGELYEFAYVVIDPPEGAPSELVVATTRPETMLGDTAVAVHPDDPRYQSLHGCRLKHPFVAREVPIVLDPVLVDMEFGTGAVKVTPAHDFNDFATGKRHQLQEINILNLDGTLNAEAGEFQGMERFAARKAVKRRLAELGLERGSRQHTMTLPRSQRSGSVVEPIISTQWFTRMEPLAKPALAAVREGRTTIYPEHWVKTYDHWLENIQDWCISRQLWWGHQIPAWYCDSCGAVNVARSAPEACKGCGGAALTQDADVLDTWFSSALWPFSTLGWPQETPALRRFYPSSDMETGYDILFFWVARMMMMGLHLMGDVPFRRVLLHGMVVDETGAKMSKVKGNTIDPLDLIQGAAFTDVVAKASPGAPHADALKKFQKAYPSTAKMGQGFEPYGADALRMTLCSYSPQAKRIALSPKRFEGYRNFCNKVYNAVRYALTYIDGVELSGAPPSATLLINRWILSRLSQVVEESTRGIEQLRLDDGAQALYHFFWDELCDWFLEASKPVFASGSEAEREETRLTLAHTIETTLRALHPYLPFITEELWQRVPRSPSAPLSIALASYPTAADGRLDAQAEQDFNQVKAAISAARTTRTEHQVHPGAEVPLWLKSSSASVRALLQAELSLIRTLVKTSGEPVVQGPEGERAAGGVVSVAGEVDVIVGLKGLVDPSKEAERIERNLKRLEKDLNSITGRLQNAKFLENAPPEVIAEVREQAASLSAQRERLEAARALVTELS